MRLQVALDLVDLEQAVDMARRLHSARAVDVIEAGTPLIKAYGTLAVSRLRACCRDSIIFADLKTMDVGALEARLAHEAGADMASVLAAAPVDTIREFVEECRRLGLKSVVDFIGVQDVEGRLREILNVARPDYVGLHVGVDVQRSRGLTAESLVDEAEGIKRRFGVGVTIAGGIDASSALKLRGRDIDIVVVGRAITSAQDPVKAALEIRNNLGI